MFWKKKSLLLIAVVSISLIGCKKKGCTDPFAQNYAPSAQVDDGSCSYVASQQNLQYGVNPIQSMELYLPAEHNHQTKVILMVHGGGWVVGYNTTDYVTTFVSRFGWDILNPLLNEGYACAVIKYRTACYQTDPASSTGESNLYFDQMMEDIDLAITHLKTNANNLGISNNHFQLLGESAGGHLVLSYALQNESDESIVSAVSMFAPTALDESAWKIRLHELDSIYPEGSIINGIDYVRTDESSCQLITNTTLSLVAQLRSFGNQDTVKIYEPNLYLQTISPATSSNIEKEIPLFIMHGEQDSLVPVSHADIMYNAFLAKFPSTTIAEGDNFAGTLKKKTYSNCGHGWIYPSCEKATIMADIVSWMNAH